MTKQFMKSLEEAFETELPQEEPQTLTEAVSNSLVPIMPRISPELFNFRREADVKISDNDQIRIISRSFFKRGFDTSDKEWEGRMGEYGPGYELSSKNLTIKAKAEIPRFFYGIFPQEEVTVSNCLDLTFLLTKVFPEIAQYSLNTIGRYSKKRQGDDFDKYSSEFNARGIKKEDRGKLSLDFRLQWEAPYKLDVSARVPEIPEGFIELGDEAIAIYYDHARQVPKELRRRTKLETPNIGILWAPTDKSLYCTGTKEIPAPELIPIPKNDPALVLDIPGEDKNYQHVVAAWKIGEEMPFRNWLVEYTEGNTRSMR